MIVTGMSEPFEQVRALNSVARPTGDAPKRVDGAWGRLADNFFDETPSRLDGIEVGRVRRQVLESSAARLDDGSYARILVRLGVVEHYDITSAEPGCESSPDPAHESFGVGGLEHRGECHPTVETNRSDHREVGSPVHRTRVEQLMPSADPGMRPSHRQIRPRFVEEDELLRWHTPDRSQECCASRLDVRSVPLRRTRPFFLKTYPARLSARWMLDRCTRRLRPTRRLYAAVSSCVVTSAFAAISNSSNGKSTGEKLPPPRGFGSSLPVRRFCDTQRSNDADPTPNCSATSSYVPSPASYAATARALSSFGWALGMNPFDHALIVKSSEMRDSRRRHRGRGVGV